MAIVSHSHVLESCIGGEGKEGGSNHSQLICIFLSAGVSFSRVVSVFLIANARLLFLSERQNSKHMRFKSADSEWGKKFPGKIA